MLRGIATRLERLESHVYGSASGGSDKQASGGDGDLDQLLSETMSADAAEH